MKRQILSPTNILSLYHSTGLYDQLSIDMVKVYTTTNPEKGEEIINKLLNEYQTQKTYLELAGNLTGEGKYLLILTIWLIN